MNKLLVAHIEHRDNDYARIVRLIDVSTLPHGTKLYAYLPQEAAKPDKGRKSDHPCKKCGAMEVYVEEINDYPDYRITCHTCKDSYCVDGSDA